MKEAAGEANMTVITIVLIGVVAAVGLLLVPRLMTNAKAKSCCTDAGWFTSGQYCCNPAAASGQNCTSNGDANRVLLKDMKSKDAFKACAGD